MKPNCGTIKASQPADLCHTSSTRCIQPEADQLIVVRRVFREGDAGAAQRTRHGDTQFDSGFVHSRQCSIIVYVEKADGGDGIIIVFFLAKLPLSSLSLSLCIEVLDSLILHLRSRMAESFVVFLILFPVGGSGAFSKTHGKEGGTVRSCLCPILMTCTLQLQPIGITRTQK